MLALHMTLTVLLTVALRPAACFLDGGVASLSWGAARAVSTSEEGVSKLSKLESKYTGFSGRRGELGPLRGISSAFSRGGVMERGSQAFEGAGKGVIEEVRNLVEYKSVVADEAEKLVVVKFYAPWCKSCAKIAPLYKQMSSTFPNVKFVEVPVTQSNTELHQGLKVPSLPFAHVYHPTAGLVEERKITRARFRQFEKDVMTYVVGSCSLDAKPTQDEGQSEDHEPSTDDHLRKNLNSAAMVEPSSTSVLNQIRADL